VLDCAIVYILLFIEHNGEFSPENQILAHAKYVKHIHTYNILCHLLQDTIQYGLKQTYTFVCQQ